MKLQPDIHFDARISVQAPTYLRDAVHRAAGKTGVSVADFVRDALSDRLDREGIRHSRLPILARGARR